MALMRCFLSYLSRAVLTQKRVAPAILKLWSRSQARRIACGVCVGACALPQSPLAYLRWENAWGVCSS